MNPKYDAQILNLTSPKFKAKYSCSDLRPEQIDYDNIPEEVIEKQYNTSFQTSKELIRNYNSHNYTIEGVSNGGTNKYAQKFFKMDNAQIQKYINNIVGGCNCPLQEDEAQTLQF